MASDSEDRLARPFVLVGFMAAGKSTIGRLIAERLRLPFLDTDAEIERAFAMPISEIFSTLGEAKFRDAERRMVSDLVEQGPRVIALGGGAFVDAETRRKLNAAARTIWLDAGFDVIAERLEGSLNRPLATGRSKQDLRKLWEQRRPSYAEAHFRVGTCDGDPADAVAEIIRLVAS